MGWSANGLPRARRYHPQLNWTKPERFRAQELRESRGGRPGLSGLNKPFCGRKATLNTRDTTAPSTDFRRNFTSVPERCRGHSVRLSTQCPMPHPQSSVTTLSLTVWPFCLPWLAFRALAGQLPAARATGGSSPSRNLIVLRFQSWQNELKFITFWYGKCSHNFVSFFFGGGGGGGLKCLQRVIRCCLMQNMFFEQYARSIVCIWYSGKSAVFFFFFNVGFFREKSIFHWWHDQKPRISKICPMAQSARLRNQVAVSGDGQRWSLAAASWR